MLLRFERLIPAYQTAVSKFVVDVKASAVNVLVTTAADLGLDVLAGIGVLEMVASNGRSRSQVSVALASWEDPILI